MYAGWAISTKLINMLRFATLSSVHNLNHIGPAVLVEEMVKFACFHMEAKSRVNTAQHYHAYLISSFVGPTVFLDYRFQYGSPGFSLSKRVEVL
jgi:hypothetical protein